MDALDKSFSDLVGILKSWIPWRPESANVSRDFWMPDHSCRVCYHCDSQFTLFNRRHHCRLCGRVFCGGCTSNCVPAPSSEPRTTCEDWDKIRVCNYCFKQWEQGLAATVNNGIQVSSLDLSSSPTATSFISTKSSDSADCSTTIASMQDSSGSYQQNPYPSEINPRQSAELETTVEREGVVTSRKSKDHATDVMEMSPNTLTFCMNRFCSISSHKLLHAHFTL